MDGAENRNARAASGIGRLAAVQGPGAQTDDSQSRQPGGDRHLPHAYQDFPSPVWSIVGRTPRHAASPSRPIEYVNCGKVGAARAKIIVSVTLVRVGLLMIVARKQHFRGGRPGPSRVRGYSARGGLRSVGRQWGERVLRIGRLGRNEGDLLGFIDHGRLPPLEGEVEKLLPCNGIGGPLRLLFVMNRRFKTQAWTTMPLDHAVPSLQQAGAGRTGT